ncbi:hypothetical protein [Ethanoligenens harbinense]|uniref:hypothetical protein n=1 Tax=Ethanoligenens harbinense TaxID=253239 RepID=UPI0010C115D5|nr:hypothetical protein [Ethanoligenens harbinense]
MVAADVPESALSVKEPEKPKSPAVLGGRTGDGFRFSRVNGMLFGGRRCQGNMPRPMGFFSDREVDVFCVACFADFFHASADMRIVALRIYNIPVLVHF